MEVQLQSYNNTLMAELGAWNRQENVFREVFGPQSTEDRQFLKMKLKEYERLSSSYGSRSSTSDERSMLFMLRYQQSKITRKLYPGILRRVLHYAAVFLKPPIDYKRELAMATEAGRQSYRDIQLPVKEQASYPQKESEMQPAHQQRNQHNQRQRTKPKNRHKIGRTI